MDEKRAMRLWNEAFNYITEYEPTTLEIARSKSPQTFSRLTPKQFLRSYCFVVYASGFKYSTIAAMFDKIEDAFCNFDIDRLQRKRSTNNVLEIFGNKRKAKNFLDGAKLVANEGFPNFKVRLKRLGAIALLDLPGIGKATAYHLAKNIGLLDAGKPDIWLIRAADYVGARDVHQFIEFIHERVEETRNVIDVTIWTYAINGMLPGYDK
tara:strand:+ start:935 stop:1561 length:627 start_codon:yes stop_codon:yes gene_type:complete